MIASANAPLRTARDRLAALSSYPWEPIEQWCESVRPLIRAHHAAHIDDFNALAKKPKWTFFPRVASVAPSRARWAGFAGSLGDEPRRQDEAQLLAKEQEINSRSAENAKQKLLAFLDGLLLLSETQAADPRPPAPSLSNETTRQTRGDRDDRACLLISRAEALRQLEALDAEAVALLPRAKEIYDDEDATPESAAASNAFIGWEYRASRTLGHMFSTQAYRSDFETARWNKTYYSMGESYHGSAEAKQLKLQQIMQLVRDGTISEGAEGSVEDDIARLLDQLQRFGDGLSRIRRENRQGNNGVRRGFRLKNEYDIQDSLWLLVRPQFPDAMTEVPTPKTGLSSSRVDLWIPSRKVAIEVKFARSSSDGKKIDAELKKDLFDYQAAGARMVIAFIAEAPGAHGLEELDALEGTTAVHVRVVRIRL